ncbi:AMP-binding protein [Photobacterium sp. BZF1]|uniref:AMP-binding protein n=1 Tax=Photobacterium sp. BZF1 TaxID=1904457 RepID=UPI001653CEBC|nr:AMP-binding protein [Photobacterium sp. BZF1]MBC7006394.1 AMP-binding protein [Photobacterium sp. BZF1]
MLFDNFLEHKEKTALIDHNGEEISYKSLQDKVDDCSNRLGHEYRKLIFIKCSNNVESICFYVACLQSGHPVLLLNSENDSQNEEISMRYKPNVIVDASNADVTIKLYHNKRIELHEDLAILLSTSGSTGSPKLVKLSKKNITSNTHSIIEYLGLNSFDRAITSLKFSYSYGISIVNSHLQVGGSIVLTELSVSCSEFWTLVNTNNVTSFSGVPYSYEMLSKQKFNLSNYPSIRYLTQAGGKLSAPLVSEFSKKASILGIKFYVMYGQTEASPRISYLPPKYTELYPDYIGLAVPGGELAIVDDEGNFINTPNQSGELVYKGPNIMMGYALSPSELSVREEITWLKTGDMGFKNEIGLFKINGRKSRFSKPFGIRVNLDDIQNKLNEKSLTAAVTERKDIIIIGVESDGNDKRIEDMVHSIIQSEYNLHRSAVSIHQFEKLPLLPNGKFNYTKLAEYNRENILTRFLKNFKEEILHLSGIKEHSWESMTQIFQYYFPDDCVNSQSSFISLAGDSLIYVSISVEIEKYLTSLPDNWQSITVASLEEMREKNEF